MLINVANQKGEYMFQYESDHAPRENEVIACMQPYAIMWKVVAVSNLITIGTPKKLESINLMVKAL